MYKCNNMCYLNKKENAELLSGDLSLIRIIHVDDNSAVPTNEYCYVYLKSEKNTTVSIGRGSSIID